MAIVTHTFISKSNTIIKDNCASVGLNPIIELNYGNMLTRGLVYFNHNKLKQMVDDKTYPDISKLKHYLKLKNSGSIDDKHIDKKMMDSNGEYYKQRAISFDIILFLIPNMWDEGRGFDYKQDLNIRNGRSFSVFGSNWYQSNSFTKWENEGIYSTERLSRELDLFTSPQGNKSKIIIAYEHFDSGNESINIDITDTVNKYITGEIPNYGIGIAFSPKYETQETVYTQYVGFFSPHTNSFFKPYIETIYDDYIDNNRENFYLDKLNKLYFHSIINGKHENLDVIPSCEVDGVNYEVKQATKGVYYIEIELDSNEYEENIMLHDIWSNIIYNNREFTNQELDFVTINNDKYFQFGNIKNKDHEDLIPTLYGIKYKEHINSDDIRKVNIDCRIPYTVNQKGNNNDIYYRLYILSGEKEIDVIDWQKVENDYNEQYFYIKMSELIPSRYYIDIKLICDNEITIHKKIIEFDKVNNITEYYN